MDFAGLTHPELLWWLLLLPVLWWLHRPPRPRRVVTTPYLALWRRAQQRLRRRPHRLRWLRLLLMLFAAAATVLALAGLRLGGQHGARALVVLLDTSASMQAGGADQRARRQVAEVTAALPDGIETALVELGDGMRLRPGPASTWFAEWPEAGGTGRDWGAWIASLAREGTALWTLTDGRGPSPAPDAGALTLLDGPSDNFAITALEVEDAWPLAAVTARVQVTAFTRDAGEVTLRVAGGVAAVEPRKLVSKAGETQLVEWTLERAAGGEVRFLLGGGDALALDDVAAVRIPPPPPRDVAVLADAEAGPWIGAAAEVLATATSGRVVGADGAAEAGFTLVEGGVFAQEPGTLRFVTFGTRRDGTRELERSDLLEHPVVVDWDREHPITAGLDLSDLRVRSALAAPLPPGRVLIRGEAGPLAVWVDGPQFPSLHFQFRLSDTNLPLLPAFPQLLRRAYAHAFGAGPAPVARGLLSAAESDLRRVGAPPESRPLPPFAEPGQSLVLPLLLAALAALVLRVYV